MPAFGGPVRRLAADAADLLSAASAVADVDRAYGELMALNTGGRGSLRPYRPQATAAFAPRDTTLPPYAAAATAMQARGFAPAERRAGGQLAVYDCQALVIDLVAPHDDPRRHAVERFARFSGAIAAALRGFGVDARVGQVTGEYCPGDHSVNAHGRVKLVGVAQRIGRCGYHLGAVVSVAPSEAAREAVAEAYRILGFSFAPESFGALQHFAPAARHLALADALVIALSGLLEIEDAPVIRGG